MASCGSEGTFCQALELGLDEPVGCLSMSPENRDVVLGARKGLFVVDLDHPYEPPRFLAHSAVWDVADIQWSPHPERRSWVASTSSQKALIWNLDLPYHSQLASRAPSGLDASLYPHRWVQSPIQFVLEGHTRAICDINWSVFNVDVLATCAIDSWTYVFDLRLGSRAVQGFCAWTAPATQVKWNRQDPYHIATSHGSYVLIWDTRKPATPLLKIKAHDEKIYGIDWSRRSSDGLVTCSLDTSVKFWSTNTPSAPLQTIHTPSPVRRARNLPFGSGVMTLPQRLDCVLRIWSQDAPSTPVASFAGHQDTVREFVWRTRGGGDPGYDDRQFQLVTWGNDRKLRLWPISSEILQKVGFKEGGPIDVRVTRKSNSASRSFRHSSLNVPFAPSPPSMSISPFKIGRISHPSSASSSATNRAGSVTLYSSRNRAVTMSEGVKLDPSCNAFVRKPIHSPSFMTRSSGLGPAITAHQRLTWMENVKLYRPSSDLPLDEASGPHPAGCNMKQTRSLSRDGRPQLHNLLPPANDGPPQALGDELAAAQRNFPQVTFERIAVQARTCSIGFYGPWAFHGRNTFLRATFSFPKSYPALKPPTIEVERSSDVSARTQAFLLKSARELLRDHTLNRRSSTFEACLRFLLGDRSALKSGKSERFVDSDEELRDADGGIRTEVLQNNVNVPAAGQAGVCFTPYGQIVYFYCGDTRTAHTTTTAMVLPKRNYKFEAFGALSLSSLGRPLKVEDESESDDALRLHTSRPSKHPSPRQSLSAVPLSRELSTVVTIRSLEILRPPPIPALESYDPLEIVESSLLQTPDHDSVRYRTWQMVRVIMKDFDDFPESAALPATKSLYSEILRYLHDINDFETLGYIACVTELEVRRYQAKKMELEKSASSTSFFNLSVINTPPRLERSEAVRTPEAPRVVENFQSPSKGSWSNFFFSLTQGTSLSNPTPLSRGLPSAAQANSATMPSPDKAVAMLKQQLGGNQAGVEGSARRDNKTQIDVMNEGPCKGPEAVAGPSTSEDMPHRKPFAPPRRRKIQITEFPSADAKPVSVLEDAEFRNALEGYKHFLCEMMMRRGQFVERSMVVKMLQAGRPDSAINSAWTARSQLLSGIHEQMDLHMSVVCSNCGTSLAAGRRTCQECRSTRALPLCCICHRPVARLARDCALCFHGGHVQCLTKWWKNGQSCPAGCGCICPLINGGGGGGFHNLAPGIVEVAAVDQLGIGNRPTVNQRRPNTNKPSSGVRWYSDVGVSSYSPKY